MPRKEKSKYNLEEKKFSTKRNFFSSRSNFNFFFSRQLKMTILDYYISLNSVQFLGCLGSCEYVPPSLKFFGSKLAKTQGFGFECKRKSSYIKQLHKNLGQTASIEIRKCMGTYLFCCCCMNFFYRKN